jgi:two-component system nitrate/nitrite response regulator NarL
MRENIHFAVLAHDAIQRQGLLSVLRGGGFDSVTAFDTIDQLSRAALPDGKRIVYLLDTRQAGDKPTDRFTAIHARHPDSLVVLIADEFRDAAVNQALQWDASSLLLLRVGAEVLIKSLELVLLGERVFPATTILKMSQGYRAQGDGLDAFDPHELLSSREVDVLCRLTAGQANKVIARDCGITESTVKVHVKAILRKIQAKNRTQAAVWARRHGMTEPTPVGPAHNKPGQRTPDY